VRLWCWKTCIPITSVDQTAVSAPADQLAAAGHRVVGLVCDVTDEEQVAAAIARTVTEFGRLDMAFNNAGVQAPPSGAADETAEDFDRVNAITCAGCGRR